MSVQKKASTKYVPAANTAVKGDLIQIPCEKNARNLKSENLDLDLRKLNPTNFQRGIGLLQLGSGDIFPENFYIMGYNLKKWKERIENIKMAKFEPLGM